MTRGDRVELSIVKLAAGGDGIGFVDGISCFVPLSAPGDRLVATIVEVKKGYIRAEISELLEPSSGREAPACPLYGSCGGCSLMHLAYEAQLDAKAAIVREAFRRVGGLEAFPEPAVVASKPFAYRNRMQFHFGPGGLSGLARRSSRDILPLRSCPIAVDPLSSWLATGGATARAELSAGLAGAERFIAFSPWTTEGSDSAVYLQGRDGELGVSVAGKAFLFHVAGFFQSNLSLLPELVREATSVAAGERAADLYSGVGLFGAFLKERFSRLVCVEQDARAVGYACRNVGAGADFSASAMEDWTKSPQARQAFDHVLVDPPRTGLAPSVRDWLARAKPPTIGYVSCDPVSLARDAGALSGAGYDVASITLYDFYPQTPHVESYARLALR